MVMVLGLYLKKIYAWEIDHFVIKSNILGHFSILKLFLKLSC
jgi:hypothetical protein